MSWVSRLVRSFEQRALWFSYSRLFFGIVFQERIISWVFRVFYKVNCGVNIRFLWHIFFIKMFCLLTCNRNHNFLSLGRHVENVFCLKKDSRDMASLWDVIRHFISQGVVFNFFSFWCLKRKAPIELVAMLRSIWNWFTWLRGSRPIRSGAMLIDLKSSTWTNWKPVGFRKPTSWAPCWEFFKNR